MLFEHYSMVIEWSVVDQVFLVSFPEWTGRVNTPTTHGRTYEEAARNGQAALEELIQIWQEAGWELPAPRIHAAV